MNRLLKIAIALGVVSVFALCAQSVNSAGAGYTSQAKVMSEYKGVKLGMKRDAVKTAMGNPETSSDTSDDFKLTGDDTMTGGGARDWFFALTLQEITDLNNGGSEQPFVYWL